jgi:hypothetical protein
MEPGVGKETPGAMVTKVVVSTRNVSGLRGFGGSVWVRLQYALGLRRLGIESFWVDHLEPVDPFRERCHLDYSLAKFRRLMCDFGFDDHYCVVHNFGESYFGMSRDQLATLARDASLLINLSGTPEPGSPLHHIPRRAYFDLDPGFTQIWALGENDLDLDRYNFFFTVGQNVGRPSFRIPVGQIQWHATLPPVVLEEWPIAIDERCEFFTTVADWWGSQSAFFQSEEYGGKREEFLRFLPLAQRVKQQFELALVMGQHDYEDLGTLTRSAWRVADPYRFAADPGAYREYIRCSRGEYSVAKSGYVKSNSGWISDRTACYLASGKPALVQSTGIEAHLPTDKGLLTFRNLDEAISGVDEINRNYVKHCAAARQLAETYFDSRVVLGAILDRVGLS